MEGPFPPDSVKMTSEVLHSVAGIGMGCMETRMLTLFHIWFHLRSHVCTVAQVRSARLFTRCSNRASSMYPCHLAQQNRSTHLSPCLLTASVLRSTRLRSRCKAIRHPWKPFFIGRKRAKCEETARDFLTKPARTMHKHRHIIRRS